jgi:hypothetical protein
MEAKIIALFICCRELFPIINMVCLMAEAINLTIGNTTVNVSIHEDNSGALVLAKFFASTVYSMKQVLHNQNDLVSRRDFQERYSIEQDRHSQAIGGTFPPKVSLELFLIISERNLWDGNLFILSLRFKP